MRAYRTEEVDDLLANAYEWLESPRSYEWLKNHGPHAVVVPINIAELERLCYTIHSKRNVHNDRD